MATTIAVVVAFALVVSPPATATFDDVPEGAYFETAVDWLVSQAITLGTSETTYSPDDFITRAQMAAFLWRYAGEPSPLGGHPFTDVPPGAYYEDAVIWLVEAGVTLGTTPTTFSPSDRVTRAQMAAFLWRLFGEPVPASEHDFADVPAGVYYDVAVSWLVAVAITLGTSETEYSPLDLVTRAQMAAFMWRAADRPGPGFPGHLRGDTDGDGLMDLIDDDIDGDGIANVDEGDEDIDGDGIPNHTDPDSDGDGIDDAEEGAADSDGDGLPNYLDDDSDGDGIGDSLEGTDDPDDDGIPNYLDDDSDGDGLSDADEGTSDPDGDGIPNYLDLDSDGDGVPDGEAPEPDLDWDGIPDDVDPDMDGDGIANVAEGSGDANQNGHPDDRDGLVNLGISVDSHIVPMTGGNFIFGVREADEQSDLNGDGDQLDWVLHMGTPTGEITNLELHVDFLHSFHGTLRNDGAVARISEADNGEDYTGDGDQLDDVLIIVEPDGTWLNLGIVDDGTLYPLADGSFVMRVRESDAGSDQNGDGDTADSVLWHMQRDGTHTNLGIAIITICCFEWPLADGTLAFQARETDHGADLTGDGDADDDTVMVYDPGSGNLTGVGVPATLVTPDETGGFFFLEDAATINSSNPTPVWHWTATHGAVATMAEAYESVVVWNDTSIGYFVYEGDAGVSLNGDGDSTDDIPHVLLDPAAAPLNLGLASFDGDFPAALRATVHGLAINVDENDQGTDLNADGDDDDYVWHVVDPTGAVTNIGLDAGGNWSSWFDSHGSAFALGQGTTVSGEPCTDVRALFAIDDDLGGYQELRNGVWTWFTYSGRRIYPREAECHGGEDLNGDGDELDTDVIGWIRDDGTFWSLAIELVYWVDSPNEFLLISLREGDYGDLNGDGDASEDVLHIGFGW